MRFRGGGARQDLPRDRFQARTRTASRRRWPASSTIRTGRASSPCCSTRTARSGTSWPRRRDGRATCWRAASRCEPKAGNCMPLGSIPGRPGSAQRRDDRRPGRQAGAGGRRRGPARGQGRRLGDAAFCRPAKCAWSARNAGRRSASWAIRITRTSASARPAACGTWASGRTSAARPEPGRPSDGRRRRPVQRRPPSVLADGRAGQGRQDPQPAQDQQRAGSFADVATRHKGSWCSKMAARIAGRRVTKR